MVDLSIAMLVYQRVPIQIDRKIEDLDVLSFPTPENGLWKWLKLGIALFFREPNGMSCCLKRDFTKKPKDSI
jgi:hypothetical protein